MATVKIPPVLRQSVGGEKEAAATGATVGEVLRALAGAHPATTDQLFSGEGGLNRYVNVYLNDEDVRVLDGLQTSVGEILQSVAESHPDTRSQLFAADGELNRYVNVYLNDEDVRVLDGLDTSVKEGDTVVILPAMAGGAA